MVFIFIFYKNKKRQNTVVCHLTLCRSEIWPRTSVAEEETITSDSRSWGWSNLFFSFVFFRKFKNKHISRTCTWTWLPTFRRRVPRLLEVWEWWDVGGPSADPPHYSVKYSRLKEGDVQSSRVQPPLDTTNLARQRAHAHTEGERSRNRRTTSSRLVCWPIISAPICAYVHAGVNRARKQMESQRPTEKRASVKAATLTPTCFPDLKFIQPFDRPVLTEEWQQRR